MKVRSFLLFLFISLFTIAADAGPVRGRVVDPDGRAVPGVQVLVLGAGGTVVRQATDAGGEFAVRTPDAGRFELRVSADGFRSEPITIDGGPTSRDLGDLRLQVSAIAESVVVSAAQVEMPLSHTTAAVTVIGGTELDKRQVHTVADAMRSVPGMTVVRYGGIGALTNIFPRGGESDYTLVLVDGIQANSFGGAFDFGHLSTINVDRIEVVRGPQSALFGSNAIGSVVRVVTRRGGPPRASAVVEGGSFGTWRTSAATSGSARGWEWGASAERMDSDGANGRQTAAGEEIANDDYMRTHGSVDAGWRAANGGLVRGEVRVARDERGFPGPFGSNPIGAFFGIDTKSRGTNDRVLMSLSGLVPIAGRWRVQGQVSHGRLDSDFESPFGPSASLSRRTAARGQLDAVVSDRFDLSAGIDYQRERAASTFITGASGEIPVKRYVAGYFAEGRWRSADRLFVNAGVRVDQIHRDAIESDPLAFAPRPPFPEDAVVAVNPKIAAAWLVGSATNFTKLRASAGTGIRPPDGFEIAFTDNPSLKPERSRSIDVGVDQAFASGRGLVEATAFFNNYDDLIVAVGSFRESSRYRTDNISNARSRGLELAGTARARTGGSVDLQLRVGYTLLDTEILAVDRAGAAPPPFTVGDPLLRRPRHQFSTELIVASGRFSGYVQGGGRSTSRDVEPSLGTFHPGFFDARGYHVWNTGASFRLHRTAEIFGRVDNLFDREFEEAFGFPALGRGAFLGLRIAASR